MQELKAWLGDDTVFTGEFKSAFGTITAFKIVSISPVVVIDGQKKGRQEDHRWKFPPAVFLAIVTSATVKTRGS
jgi:hypothetical protein